jgi:hypothetical protein
MMRRNQELRNIEKATTIYSVICVITLMVCVSLTAQNLFNRLAPDWWLRYLPWLAGLVAAEGLWSQRQLQRTSELTTSAVVYRLVELLFVFIATRLVCLPWQTGVDFGRIFISWEENLLENFFDAQFLLSLLVMIIIWGLSASFAQDLIDQEGDDLAMDAANLEGLVSDRAAAQQRLAGRVFAIGGVLVFINGLLRQEIIHIGGAFAPKQDAWHVVLYFVTGLVLLSLSQLANRRLAWAWERIPVKADIAGRWIITSIIFLLVIVLVALALPTGYTIGFLPTLSTTLGVILYLLYGLVMLILTPIFYILGWLMSLFKIVGPTEPIEPMQPPEMPPAETLTPGAAPGWLELLKSILFWAAILGVVGYSVYIYFRQNKRLITSLRQLRGFWWIAKAWKWLLSHFKAGIEGGAGIVKEGILRFRTARRQRARAESGRYISLRRLSPREKIIFYYLALLRRTSEARLPRADWQTAQEYELTLRRQLPEVEKELVDMTIQFNEARYSQHHVAESQIALVRTAWDQVRKFLRRRRQD